MEFAKSVLEQCVFQSDPVIGGIPILHCTKERKDVNRFRDLVVPIGLICPAHQTDHQDIKYKIKEHDEVIPDAMFENLFSAITIQRKTASKTRKQRGKK